MKIKHKEQILKATRKKQQITHKGVSIKITADLLTETLQVRREWQGILKVMKEENLQPRLLYPARISFKYESERKKVKLLSHTRLSATPWTVACTKLLRPWDFQCKSTGVGCHLKENQKLYRQAKAQRIQHYQTSSSTNAKGSSLHRKHRKGV